mgnify:FL=1
MTDRMVRRGSAVEGGFSYGGAVVAMLIISVVMSLLPFERGSAARVAASYIGTVLLQLCFLLAAIIPYKGTRARPRYGFTRPTARAALVAPAVAAISIVAFYGIAMLFGGFLSFIGYKGSGGTDMTSPVGIIMAIVISVILAPVCEESLFRSSHLSSLGVMLGRRKLFFRTLAMTVIGGAVFAFMHCRPEQTVYQFFFGGALVYLTIKTGTVIPAVLAHATNNIIGIILAIPAVSGGISAAETAALGSAAGIAVTVIASVALCVAGIFVIRIIVRRVGKCDAAPSFTTVDLDGGAGYSDDGGTVAGVVFTVLSLAVCVALWTITLVAGIAS